MIALYTENRSKFVNTLCGRDTRILNCKSGGITLLLVATHRM